MSHYLSLILVVPLAGAAVLLCLPSGRESAARWVANVTAMAGLFTALPLWFWYDAERAGFQFVERHSWIPAIGAEFALGVDGFSVLLVLLTSLMGVVAVLSSWRAIGERARACYVVLLLLQTAMLGTFLAVDGLLFVVFWQATLIPMSVLIGGSGSHARVSAIKYLLSTLVGTGVMLLGMLAVYFHQHAATGVYSFDIVRFHTLSLPYDLQWWVFLAFFAGFAVTVALCPLHTWLPEAMTDPPTGGSVMLAAVFLKIGTYGVFRFSLPMLPEATKHFAPLFSVLCVFGVLYGAVVALAQKDWIRAVAYLAVNQMALAMLGLLSLNPMGITGSLLQQVNHGILAAALLLLIGAVDERRRTRDLSEFGGLSRVMPVFATIFFVTTLASIGMPGLNGFIGQLMILQGVFVQSPLSVAVVVGGIAVGAAGMMRLYQRTMFGAVEREENATLPDLGWRELATLMPLVALAVWIGVYPKPFIDRLDMSVRHVIARVSPEYSQPMVDCDTTVTPEMRASTPGAQFLAAAPCGPDGEPLAVPGPSLPR